MGIKEGCHANPDQISQRNFERLGRFINDDSGIKMPDTKRTMLEGDCADVLYGS
ncbi:hypothetical protein [Rhizobium tumorigenes]|uniref:hypothetical protein n=1 Tax=Rhizobium tumorigenes TaxID=2041385 RepID=UPI00241D79C2|nr:hypothetical protein [Rhizobium tumorigenes]WFS03680.1 hypothetical protein PR016_20255 [Rhizobium tumorigenes]